MITRSSALESGASRSEPRGGRRKEADTECSSPRLESSRLVSFGQTDAHWTSRNRVNGMRYDERDRISAGRSAREIDYAYAAETTKGYGRGAQ